MKKFILIGILSLIFALSLNSSLQARTEIVDQTCAGFSTSAEFDQWMSYIVAGDQDAASTYATQLFLIGHATIFTKGESVYREDSKIFSGLVKIRRSGDTCGFWIAIEHLE